MILLHIMMMLLRINMTPLAVIYKELHMDIMWHVHQNASEKICAISYKTFTIKKSSGKGVTLFSTSTAQSVAIKRWENYCNVSIKNTTALIAIDQLLHQNIIWAFKVEVCRSIWTGNEECSIAYKVQCMYQKHSQL